MNFVVNGNSLTLKFNNFPLPHLPASLRRSAYEKRYVTHLLIANLASFNLVAKFSAA